MIGSGGRADRRYFRGRLIAPAEGGAESAMNREGKTRYDPEILEEIMRESRVTIALMLVEDLLRLAFDALAIAVWFMSGYGFIRLVATGALPRFLSRAVVVVGGAMIVAAALAMMVGRRVAGRMREHDMMIDRALVSAMEGRLLPPAEGDPARHREAYLGTRGRLAEMMDEWKGGQTGC